MIIRFGLIGFFVAGLLLIPPVIPNEVGASYFREALVLSPRAERLSEEVLSQKLVKGFGTDPLVAEEFSGWIYEASKRHKV